MKLRQAIIPTVVGAAISLGLSDCDGTPKHIETPPIPQCSYEVYMPANQNIKIAPEAVGETADVALYESTGDTEPLMSAQATLGERFDCSQAFPDTVPPVDLDGPTDTVFAPTSEGTKCLTTEYKISCFQEP